MKIEMKISIITINYNNVEGLVKTIESVKSQADSNYEWIVIDGGSVDGSRKVILENQASFSYWCSEKDTGVYNAMNKGIVKSTGEYLFFLNSGDYLFDSEVLADMATLLASGEDVIYGDMLLAGGGLDGVVQVYPDVLDMDFFIKTTLGHQACFIKRSLFQDSLYNETLSLVSDFEFFIKKIVLENSSYKHIQRIISIYDVCGISSNGELCVNERESVLRTYFPKMVYEALESATHMKQQPLYALFEELCHTRRFQYRIKPILLFLLKLNSFFSKRHYK
ncbi:glycosyltransferase family 2 protein [Bacteroides cellulosilyticus]|jgi:glycosyltransferase|nr:glycosyltransferase family 2 protein [Bacteroides cellulosilyticus]